MALKLNQTGEYTKRNKEVKYLNKDFSSFRRNLIEFAKAYYPQSYKDFNETSPGMMFIEQASYVGDVLSYYLDNQLKESLILHAQERKNLINLSYFLGYSPKNVSAANTTLEIFQIIPATGVGASNQPDYTYSLRIKEGLQVTSTTNTNVTFRTTDAIDFNDTNNTTVTVYERDPGNGEPTFYLLRKLVPASAGTLQEITKTFGDAIQFDTLDISDEDFITVVDVRDSNNNKWYEVPYLAQDTVLIPVANTIETTNDLYQFRSTVPFLIKRLKTSKRFVRHLQADGTTQLQFGSGISSDSDEFIVPNPNNTLNTDLNIALDPANFLETEAYGLAPANTELTVKYLTGGGVDSNVNQGDLTTISSIEFENDDISLTTAQRNILSGLKNSVAANNIIPATGGRGQETTEEIRQNALANYGAQNRAVTSPDYQIRVLSMPVKYGSISKSYVIQDGTLDINDIQNINETVEKNNPFAINLYVLGYNSNKNLTPINRAVKENLRTYLNEYRMITDAVNILDGFIINIGIDFQIVVYPDYNKNEVLLNCINLLKDYFNIDDWQFNQTINLSEIEMMISSIEGVSAVPKFDIISKCGGTYSSNSYNITEAIKDKILYPSLDPSIFEIKYPNQDIRGRAL